MTFPSRLDHLVYGTPDLAATVDLLERQTGVRAVTGGQHLGHGTRNALIGLGPACYLELLGPDPEQPDPDGPRWFGIDDMGGPRLITWAVTASPLAPFVQQAADRGVGLGRIQSAHRERPDGVGLHWELTEPGVMLADGLVPFFIDWGSSPHPAETAPSGVTLAALRAEHPDPESIDTLLEVLQLALPVEQGPAPALVATLECPSGMVELR